MGLDEALAKKLPKALPPRSRNVVALFVEGLPAQAIADKLKLTLPTVLAIMQQPEVQKAYAHVRMDLSKALKGEVGIAYKPQIIDKADRVTILTDIAKNAEKDSDRIAALQLLSKMAGDLVDLSKVEHTAQVDVRSLVVQIEERAQASQERRQIPPKPEKIVDVTPEPVEPEENPLS